MTSASATSHVYVGAARATSATRGGIFRKTVGEEGWTQLTKGLPEVTQVQAIVVHPTPPFGLYMLWRSTSPRICSGDSEIDPLNSFTLSRKITKLINRGPGMLSAIFQAM